ncbi:MAG TPA: GNAT family N-acetyltransferase [Niastella sp.]
MSKQVYIRPLRVEDALVSYRWRNDPKIWRFTGSRPNCYVTPEMETAWITSVLQRENEKRFAICLCETDEYIGNVFFTDIKNNECLGHIFIGEIKYWGGGRALEGGWMALEYMFFNVGLERVNMEMHKNNPGMGAVNRMGWIPMEEMENGFVKHVYTRRMFEQAQSANGKRETADLLT